MGYPILDPLAGSLVAGVIIKQSYSIIKKALQDLGDYPADVEETNLLKKSCLNIAGIQTVDLKARQSGPFLFVECTVGVDGELSASSAHR